MMELKKGIEATKIVMNHQERSDAFRQSYDRGTAKYAVVAIALGEEETAGPSGSMSETRILNRTINRDLFIRDFIDDDDDVIAARKRIDDTEEPTQELRNSLRLAIRQARYHGYKALDLAEKQVTDKSISVGELQRRKQELTEPTRFLRYLKDLLSRNTVSDDDDEVQLPDPLRLVDPDTHLQISLYQSMKRTMS
jgi:hypothetical protein